MRWYREPKTYLIIGAVAIVAIVLAVAREQQARVEARRLAPREVSLTDEERTTIAGGIAKAEDELADDDAKNDFNAYLNIALARDQLGDREGAGAIYRTMNEKFPGNYLSYQNLGMLYQEDVKCTLAREQFLQSIANAPRIPHVYRNFVNFATYDCKEHASEIPGVLQGGLAIVPDSMDFMSMMAIYHRDFGKLEDAIHWLELILVHYPDDAPTLSELKGLKARFDAERSAETGS